MMKEKKENQKEELENDKDEDFEGIITENIENLDPNFNEIYTLLF